MRSALLLLTCLAGCNACGKKTSDLPTVSDEGGIAQARFGGDPDDQPRLSFVIDTVHEKQQPKSSPPWHEPGGEWTFFDAHLTDGTKMGFGFLEQKGGGGSFSFGKGMLTVPDAKDGAKLAQQLSSAFHGKLPPANARGPLRIEPISLAILGKNSARGDNGFGGQGTWTATKLFLQRPGIEAEVFFNFDLVGKKGEFAEKENDYANDLVAFVARELRDGPPPPRTPENDPQLSAVGPKLDAWRVVQPGAQLMYFDGNRFLFTVPDGTATRVMSATTADPTSAVELARAEQRFGGLKCAKLAPDTCILTESKPTQGSNTWTSSDVKTISLVDRTKKTKRVLEPPAKDADLGIDAPISPDGAWIVWKEMKKLPKEKQKIGRVGYWSIHVVPTSGGAAKAVDDEGHFFEVIGWTGTGATLKAVVQDGARYDKEVKPTFFTFDPKTGARAPLASLPSGITKDETLSPDGKHRVTCKDGAIIVTDAAGGAEKRFPIHADDRKAMEEERCVDWASPRYLRYRIDRLGFVDIETMKLSYTFPPGEEPEQTIAFSEDFAWAAQSTKEGVRLAKVVVR
jgi:hypothetical protein